MRAHEGVPLLAIAAASGTGKTTLLRQVIPLLTAEGLRIGCIKHTHHAFEIDHEGKDSHILRNAGAQQMLLGAAGRWALMVETGTTRDAGLAELVTRLDMSTLDLVLVEGFRCEDIPRIELHRAGCEPPPAGGERIAIATDRDPPPPGAVPVLALDDPHAVAAFIRDYVRRFGDLQPAQTDA